MNNNPEKEKVTPQDSKTTSAPAEATHAHTAPKAETPKAPLTAEDNPVMAEVTLETKLADGSTLETTMVPKKRKHPGLVAVIVAIVLLLLSAAGMAIWYFCYYSNLEKVAYDAVSGLIGAKDLLAEGMYRTTLKDVNGKDFILSVTLKANQSEANGNSTLAILLSPIDANGNAFQDEPYRFIFENVVLSDGVLYIRPSELAATFENIRAENNLSDGDAYGIIDSITQAIELVDDEWWQISVPDVIDFIADGSQEAQPAKDLYACMVNVANQDVKGELAKIYSDNRFVNVTRINDTTGLAIGEWLTPYSVSFDYDKAANFVNTLPDSQTAQGVYNCYNHYLDSIGDNDSERLSADDAADVTADDLREAIGDQVEIRMDINNRTHQLGAFEIRNLAAPDDLLAFGFIYQETEVKAPENYRPITDLVDELGVIIMEVLENIFGGTEEFPDDDVIIEDDDYLADEL